MSGGNYKTFKLRSGGYADVPEDQVDNWMQEMEANGVQFETAIPKAEMTVGEPEVIKSSAGGQAPPVSQQWGPDEEIGFMDRFVNGVKGYANDFKKAGEGLVRGFNQSAYMGGADEVEAAGLTAANGGDYGANLKTAQANRDRAWDETPITYGAGRALGFVPGLLFGPEAKAGAIAAEMAAPRFAGAAAAGTRALASGANSAMQGYLGADENRGEAAARDGMIGLAGGAMGEGLTALAQPTQNVGLGLRRANAGGSASQLNKIRETQGLDQMQSGVDQDFGDLGLASSWRPQSAADVNRKVSGIMDSAGQQQGRGLDAATAAGVTGDWDSVRGMIDDSATAATRGVPAPTQQQLAMQNELQRIGNEEIPQHIPRTFEDLGADPLMPDPSRNPNAATPRELQAQKKAFEESGYPPPGSVAGPAEGLKQAAYRQAAAAPRRELDDAMMQAPVQPGMDFRTGRDTYNKAAPFLEMSGERAAQNKAGSSIMNPLTLGMIGAGAGAGALAGSPMTALAGGVAAYGVNALGRNYGQDLAGIAAQGMGGAMRGTGDMTRGAAQMGGMASSMNVDRSEGLPGETKGYLTPQAARTMLQQNPQAFGKFTPQFQRAMQSGDEGEMVRLLDSLENTSDEWRHNYLPMILEQTRGM